MTWLKRMLGNGQAIFQFIISGSIVSAMAIALLWALLSPRIEARIQATDARQTHDRDSLLNIQKDRLGIVSAGVDTLRRAARFQKNYARFANPSAYMRAVKESV